MKTPMYTMKKGVLIPSASVGGGEALGVGKKVYSWGGMNNWGGVDSF